MPEGNFYNQMFLYRLACERRPVFLYVLYGHGQLCIFGGCSGEHSYTLDNERISLVGLLHGAAAYTAMLRLF